MKKFLAISAAMFAVTAAFTGCGADRNNSSDENGSRYESRDYDRRDDFDSDMDKDKNDIDDYAHDAIDGAENAADDIIGGAGDAANDIVDGLDGDRDDRDSRHDESSDYEVTTSRNTD